MRTGAESRLKGVTYIGNFISAHVGAHQYCEDLAIRLEGAGVVVRRASHHAGRIPRMIEMATAARRAGPRQDVVMVDVFSTLAFLWAEVATICAVRCGAPVVCVLHGGSLPDLADRSPRRVSRLLKRCSATVTVSRNIQASLQPYSPRPIMYIPNAVDTPRYDFVPRVSARPHLIWLRAWSRGYRPDVAIRALAEIAKAWDGAQLQIAGPDMRDGSLDQCRELVTHLGLEKEVSLYGNIPKAEVPAFLQSGDIFLNTTESESFGVSVMEAAACGLCIVASAVGELPHLWQNEREVLLVPAGDPMAFASAVARILADPGLALRLSTNARAKAEEFSWDRILPKWLLLLQEVAGASYSS